MTPAIYGSIGNRLIPAKTKLWIIAVASSLAIVSAIVLLSNSENAYLRFGVPGALLLILVISWGLLLTIYWFADHRPMSATAISALSGYARTAKLFSSWYASLLLTCWFLSGVTFLPYTIFRQINDAS